MQQPIAYTVIVYHNNYIHTYMYTHIHAHTHTHAHTHIHTHTHTGIPTITPNITTVSRGQSASFVCQAQGNPPPTITWFKSTNQITADTPRVVLSPNRLTITNATLEDDGYYTCRAVFPRGMTEAQAYLDVMCKWIKPNLRIASFPVPHPPSSHESWD